MQRTMEKENNKVQLKKTKKFCYRCKKEVDVIEKMWCYICSECRKVIEYR